jgi:hypothetical protein
VVGFGSDPPNLLPIKGPFARNFNHPPPERQHSCRTQDPISCVSAHLPLGCVWTATKRRGIGKQLIISRVLVYQSVNTIEYLLLVSCLGSLGLGMDHLSWNANMKWSFPSIPILVHQPLYFFEKMSSTNPSMEGWKIKIFLVSFVQCSALGSIAVWKENSVWWRV